MTMLVVTHEMAFARDVSRRVVLYERRASSASREPGGAFGPSPKTRRPWSSWRDSGAEKAAM
jgi:ABC-type polar amino acid transport system ATPase subunit